MNVNRSEPPATTRRRAVRVCRERRRSEAAPTHSAEEHAKA
jgi:hypothetical protein